MKDPEFVIQSLEKDNKKKPVPSILRWQLYYQGSENRKAALLVVRAGVKLNIESQHVNARDRCIVSELKEEATHWRAIRLEFLTLQSYNFKTCMRDTVVGTGHPGFTTNQPKGVSLYATEITVPLFSGTMTELEGLGGEEGNISVEL